MTQCWNRILLLMLAALVLTSGRTAPAQNANEPAAAKKVEDKPQKSTPPIAKFVTVSGTIDEVMESRIGNVALALQNEAAQQNLSLIHI